MISSAELSKIINKFPKMTDEQLMQAYKDIDWSDHRMIDVGVLAGELWNRGYDIVEDNDTDVKFKDVKKHREVA